MTHSSASHGQLYQRWTPNLHVASGSPLSTKYCLCRARPPVSHCSAPAQASRDTALGTGHFRNDYLVSSLHATPAPCSPHLSPNQEPPQARTFPGLRDMSPRSGRGPTSTELTDIRYWLTGQGCSVPAFPASSAATCRTSNHLGIQEVGSTVRPLLVDLARSSSTPHPRVSPFL